MKRQVVLAGLLCLVMRSASSDPLTSPVLALQVENPEVFGYRPAGGNVERVSQSGQLMWRKLVTRSGRVTQLHFGTSKRLLISVDNSCGVVLLKPATGEIYFNIQFEVGDCITNVTGDSIAYAGKYGSGGFGVYNLIKRKHTTKGAVPLHQLTALALNPKFPVLGIATIALFEKPAVKRIRFFYLDTGTFRDSHTFDFPVWSLAFNPEGNTLAAKAGPIVHVLNSTGEIARLNVGDGLSFAEFPSNDRIVIVSNANPRISFWNYKTGIRSPCPDQTDVTAYHEWDGRYAAGYANGAIATNAANCR